MRPLFEGAPRNAEAPAHCRTRVDGWSRRSRPAARTARLIGAIVAGGESSRFGGEPKGLQLLGSRRIIDRVATALREVTQRVILVSNAHDAQSWLPDATVVRDVRAEKGSLVGIHTALASANGRVLVVAWDMPFVAPELLRVLANRGERAEYAAIPEGPSGPEPFCAVYATTCLPAIERAIDAGDLRMSRFVESLPAVERIARAEVEAIGDPARLFFNVNSPADLVRAERWAPPEF